MSKKAQRYRRQRNEARREVAALAQVVDYLRPRLNQAFRSPGEAGRIIEAQRAQIDRLEAQSKGKDVRSESSTAIASKMPSDAVPIAATFACAAAESGTTGMLKAERDQWRESAEAGWAQAADLAVQEEERTQERDDMQAALREARGLNQAWQDQRDLILKERNNALDIGYAYKKELDVSRRERDAARAEVERLTSKLSATQEGYERLRVRLVNQRPTVADPDRAGKDGGEVLPGPQPQPQQSLFTKGGPVWRAVRDAGLEYAGCADEMADLACARLVDGNLRLSPLMSACNAAGSPGAYVGPPDDVACVEALTKAGLGLGSSSWISQVEGLSGCADAMRKMANKLEPVQGWRSLADCAAVVRRHVLAWRPVTEAEPAITDAAGDIVLVTMEETSDCLREVLEAQRLDTTTWRFLVKDGWQEATPEEVAHIAAWQPLPAPARTPPTAQPERLSPESEAALDRGIRSAQTDPLVDLGSFAQYADDCEPAAQPEPASAPPAAPADVVERDGVRYVREPDGAWIGTAMEPAPSVTTVEPTQWARSFAGHVGWLTEGHLPLWQTRHKGSPTTCKACIVAHNEALRCLTAPELDDEGKTRRVVDHNEGWRPV